MVRARNNGSYARGGGGDVLEDRGAGLAAGGVADVGQRRASLRHKFAARFMPERCKTCGCVAARFI